MTHEELQQRHEKLKHAVKRFLVNMTEWERSRIGKSKSNAGKWRTVMKKLILEEDKILEPKK